MAMPDDPAGCGGELARPHPGCYFFLLVVTGANVIFDGCPTLAMMMRLVVGLLVVFFLVAMTCSLGAGCP